MSAGDGASDGPSERETASAAAARLAASGFPARWANAPRCVVLDTHFGHGHNVLAVWQAWRQRATLQPGAMPGQRLFIVSCAAPTAHSADAGHVATPHDGQDWADLAERLATLWPPATPDLHVLDLEPGVRLLLARGSAPWLRRLRLQADLVLLDADAPPPGNPAGRGWDTHALKALSRLARPDAVVSGAAALPRRVQPRAAPGQAAPANSARHVLVVGAGIAGACAAAALARAGWSCTVVDANARPAQQASGNPAALFHGTVHAGDGLHARFARACALHATQVYRALMAAGVPGSADGLVRAHASPQTSPQWPVGWVQRLHGTALQQRWPGLRADAAWFYPGGGWVDAAAAVQQLLAAPGIRFVGAVQARALHHTGAVWQLLDADNHPVASAATVVLATAGAGLQLLGPGARGNPPDARAGGVPGTSRSRGQVTWFQSLAGVPYPVAGGGYALAWPPGHVLCGASTHAGDDDPALRAADHHGNLERLAALTGIAPGPGAVLHGRVGWRHLTPDRLPLVGAVPCALQPAAAGLERLRDVAREPGLFMLAGLGGRGFTWAPLAGELLAAVIDGSPVPMDGRLQDAVDPARGLLRLACRPQAPAVPRETD